MGGKKKKKDGNRKITKQKKRNKTQSIEKKKID
jgi:hypothetical protein